MSHVHRLSSPRSHANACACAQAVGAPVGAAQGHARTHRKFSAVLGTSSAGEKAGSKKRLHGGTAAGAEQAPCAH